jgi:hypothetical protein
VCPEIDAYPTSKSGPSSAAIVTESNVSGDKVALDVNLVSSILTGVRWDYVGVTYPTGTTEVYTFKYGGSGGTTVATVSVAYTDSTKANLLSVLRT